MSRIEDITNRLSAFIEQEQLLAGVKEVLVGFSGGADSTALLICLQQLSGIRVTAVHLHHGLRSTEADADQRWCRTFCETRGIAFRTAALDVPTAKQSGESDETAGRRLRLDYWREQLKPGTVVALGHHLDDLVETALFRFSRGANVSGLTGLRPKADVENVPIIRPLLCLTRGEVEEYLQLNGITDWCEDTTNAQTDYARNAIRHQILPVLREVGGDYYKSLSHLRDDADYLETAAAAINIRPLHTDTAQDLHPALFPRVLRRWLVQESGQDLHFGEAAVTRLRAALEEPGGLVDFHKDWFIQVTPKQLLLQPKTPPALDQEIRWPWLEQPVLSIAGIRVELHAQRVINADLQNQDPNREFFQSAAVGETIIIRPRAPGDRMLPFGNENDTKLKKLIGDAKLDYMAKHAVFLICNAAGDILWVPGVRRAELGRVRPDDADVVELRVVRRHDGTP